jgi:hypothetical protein
MPKIADIGAAIEALSITPAGEDRTLTRDQKRFNTLVRQIGQARAALKAWQDSLERCGPAQLQAVQQLEAQLRTARCQWVFALDAAAARKGLTRAEHETLSDLVSEAAAELLGLGGIVSGGGDGGDAQLKAVFTRHAQADFDAEQQEMLRAVKDLAESMTGVDLGDDEGIASGDDLLRRMRQGMQQQQAADEARRDAKASKRRKTPAQQRREDEAQAATQSVREVFRKLASALHPDRETDADQRAAKTALMQEVNQAYARSDLLALLELQLRIEQVDAGHMANADAQRVKHYNKVLAGQLDELATEIARIEMGVRMDFGLEPGRRLEPRQLGTLLEREARAMRNELAQVDKEVALFDDPAATKRWLKAQRRRLRADDDRDLFF